jgi:malonate-semialdehyde dehydrogenase (acetylating) / methylmalonate-semialdehyde dehydrogenase
MFGEIGARVRVAAEPEKGTGSGPITGFREEHMRTIGHFIGGRQVAGTSGRFADVFQPMTGEVQAKVALASKAELRAAVENAKAAQPEWAATNPQRRVRVLMKFLELVARDNDALAELLAREHGKTFPDAKGDILRGVEVVEFALGIPQLMKGEFTEGAGPGIDLYSMRQPLGVVAGITPFNFPAMIPMWKFAPAIACGNAFILKPSERDPGVPMKLAELMLEAGLPPGILNVVNGDKETVDAILDDHDISAVGFVGSSSIAQYIYERAAANGKRVQCFGGAKNHLIIMPDADMDQTVDALVGSGYGAAGERCMAVSVAVPVGKTTADRLMEKLIPRVENLKIGPSLDSTADFGPLVTREALQRVKNYVEIGIKEGATLAVDGRNFKMQGYENGFYMGGCLFDNVTKDMRIYKEEIFGPVLSVVRAKDYAEALALPSEHEYGNGVAIFTRDGDAARDFANRVNVGMVGVNVPIPVPVAYYTFGGWKRSGFGDLNQYGPDSVRFYTKTKTVTARWPSGIKDGADFAMPIMN